MAEPFRSFASILGQHEPNAPGREDSPCEPPEFALVRAPVEAPPADERIIDLLDTFVAELARLRARAAERFEEQAEAVLTGLAQRVLARELALAPPEIEVLLADAIRELDGSTGVVVRVSPSDAERLGSRWPVQPEPGFAAGDFAVEIDDGRYDAALQTRLEAVLAAHRVAL